MVETRRSALRSRGFVCCSTLIAECQHGFCRNYFRVLVGAAGFEPATFWSQTRRATRLRYAPPRPWRIPFAGKLVTALPKAYAAGAFDTRFAFGQQGRRPT